MPRVPCWDAGILSLLPVAVRMLVADAIWMKPRQIDWFYFHGPFLAAGSMPMTRLERRVDSGISEERRG